MHVLSLPFISTFSTITATPTDIDILIDINTPARPPVRLPAHSLTHSHLHARNTPFAMPRPRPKPLSPLPPPHRPYPYRIQIKPSQVNFPNAISTKSQSTITTAGQCTRANFRLLSSPPPAITTLSTVLTSSSSLGSVSSAFRLRLPPPSRREMAHWRLCYRFEFHSGEGWWWRR